MTESDGRNFVEVDGRRFEYDEVPGDRAAPTLVFLHEGLGSVGLWRAFHRTVAAATGRRAIAYSRLGHGYSDPPASSRNARFMHDEAEAVLPALLRAWDAAEPVLVSHSDGASIALLHASGHRVSGVVAMAPHVIVEDRSIAGVEAARKAFHEEGLRARMSRHHHDVDVTFSGWNDVWLAPEFREWDITAVLPGISDPLLLIQGEHDQYGTLAQLDAIERDVRGPVRRVVLACGHSPHLELPAETLAATVDFIRRGR